ncbi:MAG: regulatory protein MarR [Chitinophagaceae bacterium]|nr:regulatory protein MarR [Chitinophagaceae bacterium]
MQSKIESFSAFIRFFSSIISFIEEGLGKIAYSTAEMSVLFELYSLGPCSAKTVLYHVKMNKGHLSRILYRLEKAELVKMFRKPDDRRFLSVTLTPKGTQETEAMIKLHNQQLEKILSNMIPAKQQDLITAMETVKVLLEGSHNPARMKYTPGLKQRTTK